MLDLQLEAVADAVGAILAQQRREWSLEHAAFVAEHKAALAELRRENAELLAALKAMADEQRVRVDAAIADIRPGEQGPPGESIKGDQGDHGHNGRGIAAIEVDESGMLVVQMSDGERVSAGNVRGPAGPGIAMIERDGPRLFIELDDGRRFDVGEITGAKGDQGERGIGLASAMIDRDGCLMVVMSNGASQNLGLVVGKNGDPGKPGTNGLGFDDLEIEHDGARSFTFRLAREGAAPKEWVFQVPAQIYRGVHVDGAQHEPGDTVTWGGSLYHCNKPTTDKPGAGSDAWTLAVKRGQDGKRGDPGTKGDPGAPGRPGKDLTQMDETGRKW